MANDGVKQLQKIDHIVVLMMENRSFDQMLGYLMRDGLPEVDGLRGDEWNEDAEGNRYPVRPCDGSEPLEKRFDPCHGPTCVSEQLENGNKGFVKNFVDNAHLSAPTDKQYRDLVMRYYTREQLPVYNELALAFCVCDRWHSSVPGDTWPNRSYSITGGEGKKSPPKFIERIPSWFPFSKKLKGIENAPIYDLKAFTRQLDNKQWRWYAHDPAILRGLDKRYRNFNVRHLSFNALNRDNFAYFDRRRVSLETRTLEAAIVGRDSFLDDAVNADPNDKTGLRDVSWIDPNFIDLRVLEANSNDDHPPADVRAGQALVLDVYEALYNSPNWEQTLFVVLYDEHGGFYDHVSPPPIGDTALHSTLGVRVPAMVIGPRVKEVVCHELFDHTTVIKTILKRFAADPDAAIAAMGPRVATAQDWKSYSATSRAAGCPTRSRSAPGWRSCSAGPGTVGGPSRTNLRQRRMGPGTSSSSRSSRRTTSPSRRRCAIADFRRGNRKECDRVDRPILRADVVAVGYGNSEEHILVVRNSWGDGWGIKGYLSLAFGYLTERGLSADFWSIRSVG